MYYEARIKAAKINPKLLTRAGAAECIPGVTEESIKRYELNINSPPEEVVALMADVYIQPELRYWYCVTHCPLGTLCRVIPEMPAERAVLRLQNSLDEVHEVSKKLAKFMEKGSLEFEHRQELPMLKNKMLELRRRTDEMLAILERAEKIGNFELW